MLGRDQRTIRTPRSSASTSSRCRSPRPRRRASSTGRAFSPTRLPARSPGSGRAAIRARHADDRASPTSVTTSPSSRSSAWPPAPARATASCSTSPIRCTRCVSIAVADKNFAYWHSATFNNDGTKVLFTDEWGGGDASALPRDRSADLGRRCHLRHRRSQAALRRVLQDAGAADRAGELRGAQRVAHPGARTRHHGAGVVSGRLVGVRLHRLGASLRDCLSSTAVRSTPSSCSRPATGPRTGTTGTSTASRSRAGSTSSG